jgi:hypothetical protein
MKRLMVSLLPVGTMIWALGCSTSYQVSSSPNAEPSYATFNMKAVENDGLIVFRDGGEVDAKNIVASRDSTRFRSMPSDALTVVPTQSIEKVVFTNHGSGFLEGFGLGALGGGVTVLVIRGVSAPGGEFSGAAYTIAFTLIGAGVGGVLGGIPGLIIGKSVEYRFPAGADTTKH